MKYSADYLVQKRKDKWGELHSIEHDKELRDAIGQRMLEDHELLGEIRDRPEKLIELFFVVVDKDQRTMPFFLNDVQRDFITR